MRALSIRQPWAWLIASGYKDVENRRWKTDFRGRIYIHAGKVFDRVGLNVLGRLRSVRKEAVDAVSGKTSWEFGAIIGEVDVVDCVTRSHSPWFSGPYGLVMRNPRLYSKSIPCRGKLGFFEPDIAETRRD